jgi:diguanylate cyclase (GGDEF)-like protein
MVDEVNHLTLYDHGYAFLNDAEGNLIYHPHMDVTKMKTQPTVPEGLLSEERFVNYRYEGVEKRAVWLPLSNGMRLNISVPVREINEGWQNWSRQVTITFAVLLLIFAFLIMSFVGRITRPLRALTRVAEQMGEGNYECSLDYDGKDEVGILTRTFRQLTENLKRYISDLNDLAYADSLTSLHNKGAFDICVLNLQKQMEESQDTPLGFAVCIFDCNGLKDVNDENGHDKGDIYLKETSKIICEVFDHSPVFRIGGDEFAAVLTGGDYLSREELLRLFDERCAEKRRTELDPWQRVDVARGMAVYDPREDQTVNDVVRRADRYMYEHKWRTKKDRQNIQSTL